jgi:hypothetical protein
LRNDPITTETESSHEKERERERERERENGGELNCGGGADRTLRQEEVMLVFYLLSKSVKERKKEAGRVRSGMCADMRRPDGDYLARLRPEPLDVSDAYAASGRRIFFLIS